MEDRTQIIPAANPNITRMNTGVTQMGNMSTQMMGGPMQTVMGNTASTLQLQFLAGNQYAMAPEITRDHGLLVLTAGDVQAGRRAPVNVCLCIDRSGSMEGEPLEYVKRACDYVVDMLEPDDILSIVTFEEQVDILMPARKVLNKSLVKEHIHRLSVGNTTNLYDGLIAGCMQIASVQQVSQGYVNRVLLLTDGEPTVGLKDYTSIVQQVAEQKARGITITALGFGPDYREELMSGIARRSGGNYYYIQRPDLLPEVFRRELESLMHVVAKNVKVKFHISRWVQMRQVYGQQPTFGPRTVEVAVPDIERGTTRTLLVDLEMDKHPAGSYRVVRAEVTFDDVIFNRPSTLSADCVFQFTNDRSLVQNGVNRTVATELEIAQASINLQRTMMGLKTQQLTAMGALTELQKTRTILMHAGQTDQAKQVDAAIAGLQRGTGDIDKTLMGAALQIDQGSRK